MKQKRGTLKKMIYTITFLTLSVTVFAQDSLKTTQISEVRKNNYQVELGLRSFSSIWNGTTTGTVLLKKKINFGDLVEVNSLKFLRAYFSVNSQVNFTDDPSLNTGDTTKIEFHPSDQVNFSLGLGYEKQNRGKFLVHYHGIDLFTQFYKTNDDFSNGSFGGITINTVGTTDRYIQTLRVGVIPFIGAKYYFTDQLSLGIETGVQISWFRTKFTEVGFEQELIDNRLTNVFVEYEPVISDGINIVFNGVRFITIGYTF